VQRHHGLYGWRREIKAASRYEHLLEMSKERRVSSSGNGSVGLQPSAFTTASSVEEAAAKAIAERLSV
jgi:hypothetical protein